MQLATKAMRPDFTANIPASFVEFEFTLKSRICIMKKLNKYIEREF